MLLTGVIALAVAAAACHGRRPATASATLETIVWKPDAERVPDPRAIGDSVTLTITVVQTGRILNCSLQRLAARTYRCLDGLPAIPVTRDGPDNIVTVGWGSGETGYGIVLNGQLVQRVSRRFDGWSQGQFRIVDASGRIQ